MSDNQVRIETVPEMDTNRDSKNQASSSSSAETKSTRRISPAPSMLIIVPHSSELVQMQSFLQAQLEKCTYYKETFGSQSNASLASQFETLETLTKRDLEILKKSWQEGGKLPLFKFETVRLTCTPTNVDIKDKELQLIVKTSNLPVADGSMTYVIGEFEFPLTGKEESSSETMRRWYNSVKIDSRNLLCCSGQSSRQLDIIHSTTNKPFYDLDSKMIEYDKPMFFFVEKGRSRTLKRKFKPIKLTFYEKTNFLHCDKKIGTVQVKIDAINDDASLIMRSSIMNGRKATEALADIRVRVREPLVDKSIKTHEEKILVLT